MPNELSLLVVEDEPAQRRIIADILRKDGFAVSEAPTGEDALVFIERERPEIVLCDWKMPGMGGGGLLKEVRERGLPCAFVVMTAYGSISHAVEAVRLGADDYLAKPFEKEALLLAIRRIAKTSRLEKENRELREAATEYDRLGDIVGRAPTMQTLYKTLRKVAATEATILLNGESGTGKELFARTIHAESSRAAGPFVAVNCAGIPETLIESELFGHERGAFTGADRRREGKFEQAEGGTLFLDEIPSMPLAIQTSLLRVLQERRFTRLGGRGEIECNVRIVAASNRDLAKMVTDGTFREDLYYRLNVLPLAIPPLRERREDIPLLAAAFHERVAKRYNLTVNPLPANVLRQLMTYDWPGNVRELSNVIERLVLLAEDGSVKIEDLPAEISNATAESGCPFKLPPGGILWEQVESGLLRQALDRSLGNRMAAAKLLGMSYKTFLYRLEKYEL